MNKQEQKYKIVNKYNGLLQSSPDFLYHQWEYLTN